ncbi:hypothetical protein AOLI_G00021850 [Acnodon oligacanthus]
MRRTDNSSALPLDAGELLSAKACARTSKSAEAQGDDPVSGRTGETQKERDGASRADGGSLQKSSGAGTQWPPLLFSPPLLPLPGSNVNPARAHGLGSNEEGRQALCLAAGSGLPAVHLWGLMALPERPRAGQEGPRGGGEAPCPGAQCPSIQHVTYDAGRLPSPIASPRTRDLICTAVWQNVRSCQSTTAIKHKATACSEQRVALW